MCDDINCEWRIKYFAAVKRYGRELSELRAANRKFEFHLLDKNSASMKEGGNESEDW